MGKKTSTWAEFVGVLPELVDDEDPKRQAKIEIKKQHVVEEIRQRRIDDAKKPLTEEEQNAEPTPVELAQLYEDTRIQADDLGEQLALVNLKKDALEQLIKTKWERQGLHRVVLSNGADIGTEPEPYPKIKDREAFRLWCIENGLEKELQLHHSTTKAMFKLRLRDGLAPPDCVELFMSRKVKRYDKSEEAKKK